LKQKLNSCFNLFAALMFAFSMQGQSDSLSSKQKKKRFGVELGVGKPPVINYSENWIKEKDGRFNTYIKPISYSHLYFSYSFSRRNNVHCNIYIGAFRTNYNFKTYSQWYQSDSVWVYGVSTSNQYQTSFSTGFSVSKKLLFNKARKLFFAPEIGLFLNRLFYEKIKGAGTITKYRTENKMLVNLDPLEKSNFQGVDKYSLFNAPSNIDDLYSICPMLRIALIKQLKNHSLQINFSTVFLPYYSINYYRYQSIWQFSNVSFGLNF